MAIEQTLRYFAGALGVAFAVDRDLRPHRIAGLILIVALLVMPPAVRLVIVHLRAHRS